MGSRRLTRLLCTALALIGGVPAIAAAADTWPAGAGTTVYPDSVKPADAPAALSLAAGRDDYEGGQAVIRSDTALSIQPTVTALTGPGTIPASAVRLYRVGYVKLTTASTGVDALHGDGRYPDPLIPADGTTVNVPAGETTSLYALVHVPADAAAGTYTGSIDLGAAGQMPLSVEVAPVTVNRNDYRVVARFNGLRLADALGVNYDDPAYIAGVYGSLLPMLNEHGISPGRAPFVYPRVADAGTIDWAGTPDRRLSDFLAMGFNTVEVPFLPNLPWEDRTYTQDARRRAAAQSIATRYASVIRSTFSVPIDEPNPTEYGTVVRAAAQLHSANPAIPVMVTEPPSKAAMAAMGSAVDIWTPPLWDHYKDPAASRRVLDSGKNLWWYVYGTDVQRYTPNVLIDKPTTEPRVMGWLAERDGIQGFYYWGLNNWEDGNNGFKPPTGDPWYLSHTKINVACGGAKRLVGGNGEASLIWPGSSPSQPAYGSMRLEALRDGVEDYSVMEQLRTADPAYHDRLLSGFARPYTGASDGVNPCSDSSRPGYLPVVETDPASVDAARRAALDRLAGKPLPALSGRVVFGGSAESARGKARSLGLSGRGVPAAVVRFAGFETVTDRNGNWSLTDLPNTPGTLSISRDPAGRIDPASVQVSTADLAAGTVQTPTLPAPTGRPLVGAGLTRFTVKRAPARVRRVANGITATLSNKYNAEGISAYEAGGTTPSVEAGYPRVAATKGARDWRKYRYLDMTVEVLKDAAPGQRWYLIVTPGGDYRNARNLSVGRKLQHVRLDLRFIHPQYGAMRRMNDVRYIRFGVASALPQKWRGNHTPTVTLKITDMTLVQ